MVGNSAEEGLILQVKNPSHSDVGRAAAPAGIIAGLVAFWLSGALPLVGIFPRILLGLTVALALGGWLYRRMMRTRLDRAAAERAAARQRDADEAARQIAAMKADR